MSDSPSLALQELKTRARLRLNALRAAPPVADGQAPRLRDCLHAVSRAAGFVHWEHARQVLSGEAAVGDDLGRLWHGPGCRGLLNPWFGRYDQAAAARAASPSQVLLPYARQFLLADANYLAALGMDPALPLWDEAERDLVRHAGSPAADALARLRLQAMRREV